MDNKTELERVKAEIESKQEEKKLKTRQSYLTLINIFLSITTYRVKNQSY